MMNDLREDLRFCYTANACFFSLIHQMKTILVVLLLSVCVLAQNSICDSAKGTNTLNPDCKRNKKKLKKKKMLCDWHGFFVRSTRFVSLSLQISSITFHLLSIDFHENRAKRRGTQEK
jgi:hypothetical protein